MWIQGLKGLISYQPIPLFGLFFSSCTYLISEFPLLHKPRLHFPPLLFYVYLHEGYLPYIPPFHLLSNDLKYLTFFFQTLPTSLPSPVSLSHLHSVFKYAFQRPILLPSSQPSTYLTPLPSTSVPTYTPNNSPWLSIALSSFLPPAFSQLLHYSFKIYLVWQLTSGGDADVTTIMSPNVLTVFSQFVMCPRSGIIKNVNIFL